MHTEDGLKQAEHLMNGSLAKRDTEAKNAAPDKEIDAQDESKTRSLQTSADGQ